MAKKSSQSIEKTEIISSFYRDSEDFNTLFNYRILRTGHLKTASDYHIQRQSVVGHEFIYCLQGAGWIKSDGTLYRVEKNQLAWLPVRWPHEHYPDKDDPWEIYWMRVDGGKLDKIISLLEIQHSPIFNFSHPGKIIDIFQQVFEQMHSHTLLTNANCDRLCSSLIALLLEVKSAELLNAPVILHKGLARLIYKVHSHYSDEWDINKFIQYCQVSKSKLFRLFKITFDETPLKWLKNYRMSQARRLLVETDASIATISWQVGYEDPLHFSRDFHKIVGVSPARFRKNEIHDRTIT